MRPAIHTALVFLAGLAVGGAATAFVVARHWERNFQEWYPVTS